MLYSAATDVETQEIFDTRMKETGAGSRFEPDVFQHAATSALLIHCRSRAARHVHNIKRQRREIMPLIHVDIVNSGEIAAYAFSDQLSKPASQPIAIEFIGFTTGLVVHAFQRCRALSNLPDIRQNKQGRRCSQDRLAVKMFATFFDFVVRHEIAHLYNGHVDYVDSLLSQADPGHALLLEPAQETHLLPPLTQQALEMDADQWAGSQAVRRIVGHNNVSNSIASKTDTAIVKDLLRLSAVIYSYFWLQPNDFRTTDLKSGQTHPRRLVRANMIHGTILTLLQTIHPRAAEEFSSASRRALELSIAVATTETGQVVGSQEEVDDYLDAGSIRKALAIQHKYADIYPELRKFARFKLAPPRRDTEAKSAIPSPRD